MWPNVDPVHWHMYTLNIKVVRMTALVVTGDVEGKLQRLQWRPEQSPCPPFRFCVSIAMPQCFNRTPLQTCNHRYHHNMSQMRRFQEQSKIPIRFKGFCWPWWMWCVIYRFALASHGGTTEEGNCSYLLPREAAAGSNGTNKGQIHKVPVDDIARFLVYRMDVTRSQLSANAGIPVCRVREIWQFKVFTGKEVTPLHEEGNSLQFRVGKKATGRKEKSQCEIVN